VDGWVRWGGGKWVCVGWGVGVGGFAALL
jgi:hypothetical protein